MPLSVVYHYDIIAYKKAKVDMLLALPHLSLWKKQKIAFPIHIFLSPQYIIYKSNPKTGETNC